MSAWDRYAVASARRPSALSGSEALLAACSALSACLRMNLIGLTILQRMRDVAQGDPCAQGYQQSENASPDDGLKTHQFPPIRNEGGRSKRSNHHAFSYMHVAKVGAACGFGPAYFRLGNSLSRM
jgi:hypothetical protein